MSKCQDTQHENNVVNYGLVPCEDRKDVYGAHAGFKYHPGAPYRLSSQPFRNGKLVCLQFVGGYDSVSVGG